MPEANDAESNHEIGSDLWRHDLRVGDRRSLAGGGLVLIAHFDDLSQFVKAVSAETYRSDVE